VCILDLGIDSTNQSTLNKHGQTNFTTSFNAVFLAIPFRQSGKRQAGGTTSVLLGVGPCEEVRWLQRVLHYPLDVTYRATTSLLVSCLPHLRSKLGRQLTDMRFLPTHENARRTLYGIFRPPYPSELLSLAHRYGFPCQDANPLPLRPSGFMCTPVISSSS